jgi:hypothetical protein
MHAWASAQVMYDIALSLNLQGNFVDAHDMLDGNPQRPFALSTKRRHSIHHL